MQARITRKEAAEKAAHDAAQVARAEYCDWLLAEAERVGGTPTVTKPKNGKLAKTASTGSRKKKAAKKTNGAAKAASRLKKGEAAKRIRATLAEYGPGTAAAIAEQSGVAIMTVRQALGKMLEREELQREDGRNPRYSLPDSSAPEADEETPTDG